MLQMSRDELIARHIGLVKSIVLIAVKRTQSRYSFDDLLSYGIIGLIEAADSHIPGRCKFTSYAYHRIRGAVIDGIHTLSRFGALYYHRVSRGKVTLAPESQIPEVADQAETAEETLLRQSEVQRVLETLACLSPAARDCLLVVYGRGETIEAYGRRKGYSKSWMCRLVHAAREDFTAEYLQEREPCHRPHRNKLTETRSKLESSTPKSSKPKKRRAS